VKEEPKADECPNCGAPLELDESGHCHYCGAHISLPDPVSDGGTAEFLCNDGTGLPLPVFPLLSGLWMLSTDGAARRALGRPGFIEPARCLTAAVEAAGERAADAGLREITIDPKAYTPEELWTFHLARDLIAEIAAVDGVDRESARLAKQTVADTDDAWGRAFKKAEKKLGAEPESLREFRAQIPRSS
jgi:hypothetical protein